MPILSPNPKHDKVLHGECPVCHHYGDDCTGQPALFVSRGCAIYKRDLRVGTVVSHSLAKRIASLLSRNPPKGV